MHEVLPYEPWDSAAEWHSGEGKPILSISSTSHPGIQYILLSEI